MIRATLLGLLFCSPLMAQVNNCETAVPFVDNSCISFSPPRASVERCYTFTPPGEFVDFTFVAFVPQGTCQDAVTTYTLYDNFCNELEGNPDGSFGGLLPFQQYRICFRTTCPTEGVVNFLCAAEEVALPITLLEFTAEPIDRGVLLMWATGSESNNQGFDIQRSPDTFRWTSIGYVPGLGYSYQRVEYSHLDSQPQDGVNYYRLNTEEGSDIIAVVYRKDQPFRFYNVAGQRVRP